METLETIRCAHCRRLHDANEQTFVAISGNVTVGFSGGLIGNNLDEYRRVIGVTAFCLGECFEVGLLQYLADAHHQALKNLAIKERQA